MSIFRNEQTATDYSPLKNPLKFYPTNLDGVTERLGQFLVMEIKCGEDISLGQYKMLAEFAKLPQFTVLIVNCEWLPAERGARLFKPESYSIMGPDGKLSTRIETSTADFASRYERWARQPKEVGIKAWESITELNPPAMAETGTCEK